MPFLNRGIGDRDRLLSLGRVEGLGVVELRGDSLYIGAIATHTELAAHPLVREHAGVLSDAAAGIGDVQVRNRGTIGGVVAYGNAGADYVTALPALGARVFIGSSGGVRDMAVEDFVVDLRRTALARNELVLGVDIPVLADASHAYKRFFRVQGAAPTITAAVVLRTTGGRLCVGGATPRPTVVTVQRLSDGLPDIDDALARLDEKILQAPFGDSHNPAPYRRAMAAVFARRALVACTREER